MAITISELRAIITADDTQYQQRMAAVLATSQKAQAQTASTASLFDSMGPALLKAGAAISGAITIPFVALSTQILKIGSDFQNAMNIMGAVTQATGDQMKKLEQTAIALGADLSLPKTSATDAAKAMTELAKAGLSVNQVMDAAKGTLELAAAANISEANAAKIVTDALVAFHREASEAKHVADLLANAASATKAEITDVGLSLAAAGAQFQNAKIPLEDLVTSIGLMAQAGIRGEKAGTDLKVMIQRLTSPTGAAAAAMKQLGINVFDAHGSMLPLPNIVEQFSTKLGGLTDQQRLHAVQVIFGTRANRAAFDVLLAGLPAYEQMKAAIERQGSAADLAAARMKGFSGAMEGLKSQLETLGLVIFQSVAPALETVTRFIADLAAKAINVNPQIVQIGIAFAGTLAVFGPVLLALGGIVTFLGGPVAIALAAAAVSVAAFAAAYASNFDGIRDKVNSVISDLTKLYQDHKVEIDLLVDGIKIALELAAKLWIDQVATILDAIKVMTLAIRAFSGDYRAAWEIIVEEGKREQEKAKKDADGWAGDMFKVLQSFATLGIPLTRETWNIIKDICNATWESLKIQATNAWNFIGDAIVAPLQRVLDWIKSKADDFRQAFDLITAAARAGLQVHSPPIAAVWVTMIGEASVASAAATKKTAPQFGEAFSAISAFANTHLPKVVGLFVDLAGVVVKVLESLKVKVPAVLGDIFGKIGKTSGAQASKTGETLGGDLVNGFNGALQSAAAAVGTTGSKTAGVVSAFVSATAAGIQAGLMFGPLAGAAVAGVTLIGGLIGALFKSPLAKAQEAAALQEARDAIQLSMQRVLKGTQEVLQSGLQTISMALDLAPKLAEFEGVSKAQIQKVFKFMTRIVSYFLESAKLWAGENLAQAKQVAETIGPIFQVMTAIPQAEAAINSSFGVSDAQIDIAFNSLDKIIARWSQRAEQWIGSNSKQIMKVAERLAPAINLFSPLIQAISDTANIKEPTDAELGIVSRSLDKIITMVGGLAEKFEKPFLKALENLSVKVGPALQLWKDDVDLIRASIDVPALKESDAENVIGGLSLFLDKLIAKFSTFNTEGLGKMLAVVQAITPVASALKAWLETSTAARGYTELGAAVWDAISTDFDHALSVLASMATRAVTFDTTAHTFESYIASASISLSHAFTMLSQIMNAAGSFFVGGSPTAALVTPTSAAMAPLARNAPASATMGTFSKSGTTTIHLSLTLHEDDPKSKATLKWVQDTFGAGVLTGASSQFA